MKKHFGFSIVELMVAITISFILSVAIIGIYLAQTQSYKTTHAQAIMQNSSNAITNLVLPIVRGAGFAGCSTVAQALSILNSGGSPPLGTLNTTPSMLVGYDGGTGIITVAQDNSANDVTASDWSPALDTSLVGLVEKNSDVLVVLGAVVGSVPIGITAISAGSSSFQLQSNTTATAGQFGAISDCGKSLIFQITDVSGTTITHNTGAGVLTNSTNVFVINFPVGTQFMPLQQTAFFVAKGQGGESALMRGILNGNVWTAQPLVPGVIMMKVLYGIGANGVVTQYVSANAVPNWAAVYAVKIGFLIEGADNSNPNNPTQFTLLGTTVNVPTDNKLRHVYEVYANLRNALL